MSKSIYEEAIGDLSWVMSDEFDDVKRYQKLNFQQRLDMCIGVRNILEQAQKQEKLLKLYEKLADHRLRFINEVLDDITYLTVVDPTYNKDDIDDIMVEAKKHGDEDTKIVKEIAKIRLELENGQ